MDVVDLRSDTVTRPTAEMREAMFAAPLGDDVLGDDPTAQRLEALTADLTGKDAALWLPSGTMANQVALGSHTRPGDAILADAEAHILYYEVGAPAALWGLMT
ncbi:MAG: low specificity L-threonine aldolase, partial [Chloroflexota bacterium]